MKPNAPMSAPPSSSDRVKAYLDQEFAQPELAAGTRLPPVRAIARRLGVSSSTVQQAYQELAREGKIVTGVGRGTFLVDKTDGPGKRTLCFGLEAEPFNPSNECIWTFQICQSILSAAAKLKRRVSILPLINTASSAEPFAEVLHRERDSIDGLITFPLSEEERKQCHPILADIEAQKKPVVSIHPSDFLSTKNFISADFYSMGRAVARAMCRSGRQRVMCLCNGGIHTSVSAQMRVAGLMEGISEGGRNPLEAISLVDAEGMQRENAYEAVRTAIGRHQKFDLIYSFGLFLANGAISALREAKISIPDDVGVVTDSHTTDTFAGEHVIAGLVQPIPTIGEQVIEMLLRRKAKAASDEPGVYLSPSCLRGNTVSSLESDTLEETFDRTDDKVDHAIPSDG